MYHNKFEAENSIERKAISPIELTNDGAQGIIDSISLDYEQSLRRASELSGYARERELAIADEHSRETKIFQKVLTKESRQQGIL